MRPVGRSSPVKWARVFVAVLISLQMVGLVWLMSPGSSDGAANEVARLQRVEASLRERLRAQHSETRLECAEDPFLDDEERELHRSWLARLQARIKREGRAPAPFLFVHIAKTGGTSLAAALRENSDVFFQHLWHRKGKEVIEGLVKEATPSGKIRVVGGHLCWGIHRWWESFGSPLKEYTYVTVLRDPIQRVMSHYRYHLNPQDPSHFLTENRTFLEWIRDIRFGQNVLTAQMAGSEHYAWWNEGQVELLPKDIPFPEYAVTEQHYRQARRNLITSIVGLQEDFDGSLKLFSDFFGTDLLPRHDNVGVKSKYDFSEHELAVIRMLNHWDLELYKLGAHLYKELSKLLIAHS